MSKDNRSVPAKESDTIGNVITSGVGADGHPTGSTYAIPAPRQPSQLERRLAELKSEFEAGQKMLTDLAGKRNELEATMLRISGAIQVLEELLAKPEKEG